MRFPMNTYQGKGTSRGKEFQLNVITILILVFFQIFFIKWQFLFSHIQCLFQDLIFGEATYFHFFRVTCSTQHNRYCFGEAISSEQLLFLRSSVFRTVTFSQQLFFQNTTFSERNVYRAVTSWEQEVFRAVTCRNSDFFGGRIVQNEDIQRRAPFSKQVILRSIRFFRRVTFSKKLFFQNRNIPHYLRFLESYLFRVATFSKDVRAATAASCYSSYLFRRTTFSQHTFPEELLFRSYAFSRRLHLLFISQ